MPWLAARTGRPPPASSASPPDRPTPTTLGCTPRWSSVAASAPTRTGGYGFPRITGPPMPISKPRWHCCGSVDRHIDTWCAIDRPWQETQTVGDGGRGIMERYESWADLADEVDVTTGIADCWTCLL